MSRHMRTIPSSMDGLKPSHRKILFNEGASAAHNTSSSSSLLDVPIACHRATMYILVRRVMGPTLSLPCQASDTLSTLLSHVLDQWTLLRGVGMTLQWFHRGRKIVCDGANGATLAALDTTLGALGFRSSDTLVLLARSVATGRCCHAPVPIIIRKLASPPPSSSPLPSPSSSGLTVPMPLGQNDNEEAVSPVEEHEEHPSHVERMAASASASAAAAARAAAAFDDSDDDDDGLPSGALNLMSMGYNLDQVLQALAASAGDVNAAADFLFTNSGSYGGDHEDDDRGRGDRHPRQSARGADTSDDEDDMPDIVDAVAAVAAAVEVACAPASASAPVPVPAAGAVPAAAASASASPVVDVVVAAAAASVAASQYPPPSAGALPLDPLDVDFSIRSRAPEANDAAEDDDEAHEQLPLSQPSAPFRISSVFSSHVQAVQAISASEAAAAAAAAIPSPSPQDPAQSRRLSADWTPDHLEQIAFIAGMGFTIEAARQAYVRYGMDADRAVNSLLQPNLRW